MSGSVRYRVRHETVYSYGGDVAHSHQLLHLSPRNALRQTCHACTITLMPQPTVRCDDIDAFGNHVTRLEYEAYPEMIDGVFRQIADEMREKFAVDAIAIHHRIGTLARHGPLPVLGIKDR